VPKPKLYATPERVLAADGGQECRHGSHAESCAQRSRGSGAGGAAVSVRRPSAGILAFLTIYLGVPFLGVLCLAWTVIALPARVLLPRRRGIAFGRAGISQGFRLYVNLLRFFGAYRFDTQALEALAGERGVIIAPNHPGLIDAVVLLAHHPDMACIMKTALMRNVFLGAGARLAGFICNTPPRRMIQDAVEAVQRGAALLLFPEGTRSRSDPVNEFQLTAGAIAKHARAPVVTVLIDCDSPYLGKGWPLFRVPALPITYRVRLGRRFAPPNDVRAFTEELEAYFRSELEGSLLSGWLPHAGAASEPAPRAAPPKTSRGSSIDTGHASGAGYPRG
jgi:1-acyl-sn-glycerol-3-phosphate acyltransferase